MAQKLNQKILILNKLGTQKLTKDIQEQEDKLENLLKEDSLYRNRNVRYLASYGEDCAEVKEILAGLALNPPVNPDGKKSTVAQLEAWLKTQRTDNPILSGAIQVQNEVTFNVENNRIAVEMAKKRLESLKGLLSLRTAQIEFLRE